eukprot:16282001-Heterocapsa_arctica.AAC.1
MMLDIVNVGVIGRSMEVGTSGHLMIDIADFDGESLLIADCEKFRIVSGDAIELARQERERAEGEMEFAVALYSLYPRCTRDAGDRAAWEWANRTVQANSAGLPGPGSIVQ